MQGYKKYLTEFKKGTVVYKKGDIQTNFFIINSGKVQLRIDNPGIILCTLSKGDFFGEESLNENQQAAYDVEVLETANIIKIPYPSLEDMMKQNTDISLKILKKLSSKDIKIFENLLDKQNQTADKRSKTDPSIKDETSEELSGNIKAYLVIKRSNRIVQLRKVSTFLGRRDYTTGFIPDVDLTKEDEEKYISRKHAGIAYNDGKFYLSEESGAINGTFLNGNKLNTGVKYELNPEDEITLCHLNIIFKF